MSESIWNVEFCFSTSMVLPRDTLSVFFVTSTEKRERERHADMHDQVESPAVTLPMPTPKPETFASLLLC